jgi:RNA polymerase sigma-32 factor
MSNSIPPDHADDPVHAPIRYRRRQQHPGRSAADAGASLSRWRGSAVGTCATLDPRSRRIVESRWLGGDGGPTLHELAAEFGVSAERIRQIEVQAMKRLRVALEAQGVTAD